VLRLIHLLALLDTLYNPSDANHKRFRVAELLVPIDRALEPVLVYDMGAALSHSPQQLQDRHKSVSLAVKARDDRTYSGSRHLQHFDEECTSLISILRPDVHKNGAVLKELE
jgi:hypothetical protein